MGLNCSGGAREVGLTTTRSTALVIVGIIILDGILTPILHG
jgi:ABC-type transporter Mla maintaining outer membrane lipid asymmetry permease subunit MlaE